MHLRSVLGFVVSTAVGCAASPSGSSVPPPSVTPKPARSWSEIRAAARAARASKDMATYAARVADLVALSGSSQYTYELAVTEARLGRRDAAIVQLQALATMRLAPSIDDEPAFASLASDPRVPAIRAQMKANGAPIANEKLAFTLPKDDLITEDVAFDATTKTFFVSSVRKRKIIAIAPDGSARDFVTSGADGVGSICGLAAEGGRLWATTADLPQASGHDDAAPRASALLAYDIATAHLVQRIALPVKEKHALTDVAVASDGTVFASDALGGMVYELRRGATSLVPMIAEGELTSPQTPAPTSDGRRVLIPDYGRGIAIVDRATHAVTWLAHGDDAALDGVDGMVLDGTSLYAAQNGTTPVRVVRFTLDASLTRVLRADVLEQATPGFGEPTHCTLVDGALHVLVNAGWNRFGDDGTLLPNAPPDGPALWILRP